MGGMGSRMGGVGWVGCEVGSVGFVVGWVACVGVVGWVGWEVGCEVGKAGGRSRMYDRIEWQNNPV